MTAFSLSGSRLFLTLLKRTKLLKNERNTVKHYERHDQTGRAHLKRE